MNFVKQLIICITIIFTTLTVDASIHCTLNGYVGQKIHLGAYRGNQIISKDSVVVDITGKLVFKSDKYPSGLYSLVLENGENYDFLFIKNSNLNLNLNLNKAWFDVIGNELSEAFNAFRYYIQAANLRKGRLNQRYEASKNIQDSISFLSNKRFELDNEIKRFYETEIHKHSGTFYSEILLCMLPIRFTTDKVENFGMLSEFQKQLVAYNWTVNQYVNGLVNASPDIINSPFYENRLNEFFKKVIIQIPDSIHKYAILLIEAHKNDPQLFKYTSNYFFRYAINSNVMGIDAMLVDIAHKYYLSGKATWVDSNFLVKLKRRVAITEPTLVGKKAPELMLESWIESNGYYDLHQLHNKYTILVFWEPGCNFCEEAIPYIKNVEKEFKSNRVGVYAVNTQFDKQKWVKFIVDNELTDWVHVYDPTKNDPYKTIYDISGTPAIYVLDEQKKIVAKKFSAQMLKPIINRLIQNGSIY